MAECVQELLHRECEVAHGAEARHVQDDGLRQDGAASCRAACRQLHLTEGLAALDVVAQEAIDGAHLVG